MNIHTSMMMDILHQLLKGIVMRLIEWIGDLVNGFTSNHSQSKKRKRSRAIEDQPYVVQLDERFRAVPKFHNLKRFTQFSTVAQWTGNEQKAIIR